MDPFNYLAVMVSIVLGLGLTQLLAGIGNLVQIRRRVKRFRLHTFWVVLLIGLHLHAWWSFWALRVVPDWTYVMFLYVMIGPGLLVIASHIIVPELIDGRIDIERHYFDTGPLFFGILAATGVWALCLETFMALRPFFVPFRLLQAAGVAAFVSCALSKSRRVHAIAVGVIVLLLVAGVTLTRYHFGRVHFR